MDTLLPPLPGSLSALLPYGVATREALDRRGLWKDLQPKIVLAENVRQSFQYSSSGNADAVLKRHGLFPPR